jgi:hypothetical protein
MEEYNLATTAVMKTVGMLVASFLLGMGLFFVLSPNEKQVKKQQLEEVLSYIIQFIIYLWIGKAIIFFPKVIQDPIAVLAYPSNSTAFYLASIFTLLHLVYKIRKGTVDAIRLFEVFVTVWIGAMFTYEFLSIIINGQPIDAYFIGLIGLVIFLVIIYEKMRPLQRDFLLIFLWLLLAGVISLGKGYIVLFGFLLQPIYFFVLIGFLLILIWKKRNFKKAD